jgi:fructose-bisphosphate aldolase class I
MQESRVGAASRRFGPRDAGPTLNSVSVLTPPEGQEEADARLRKNHGVVASFSRALLEGLSIHQNDAEFNAMLDTSIQRIYEASIT